jgi:allantoinase
MFDLAIRGGRVVTPDATTVADVGIRDGAIEQIGVSIPAAKTEIDASGLLVLPGLIDVHVHFNQPGREHWEGAATGSRALAAGGGTLFFDMPLNSTPCVVNAREFDRKSAALAAHSIADYGIWGGLVPGNVGHLPEMAERGAVGFKAFLCDSGLPEFARADDFTLYEGMRAAARLGLPVAIHAENQELTAQLAARARSEGRTGVRDFLDSRPVIAETEAIARAAAFAAETGAKLHIVHVSSGRGVAVAAEARKKGVDISIETCPHYLHFTCEDLERIGAAAKCAPPLRDPQQREALWSHLIKRDIDIVASDHSPAPPEMKRGGIFEVWGGIAGIQSTLPVLINDGHHQRGLSFETIAQLISGAPARRFRIERKGRLTPGYDADLALLDVSESGELRAEQLLQRHAISPYLGTRMRGVVRRTIRRGETIFSDGAITAACSRGALVRPDGVV